MQARARLGSRATTLTRWSRQEATSDASSATRIAELDPPGRDGVPVGPGVWETSGIIDASSLFIEEAWLFDVQAHSPTAAPAPNTVEDGQLLLMTRNN